MIYLKLWPVRLTFIAAVCLGLVTLSNVQANENTTPVEAEKMIFDFDSSDQAQDWLIVNDGVMGGVSQSEMIVTPAGTALFRGNVSLENNGGFASVRTYPIAYQLADYEGLSLRVKGDGQQYKLRLRTDNYLDGMAYQASFQTQPDTWLDIRVPFVEFVPVYRGTIVPDAPKLDPARIAQIGFMISNKRAGPFELEIDWIKAYQENTQVPAPKQGCSGETS
jgi:NADH dehydrogenase [ubiquinone] 1 alpha subcomplex assembly factor 1